MAHQRLIGSIVTYPALDSLTAQAMFCFHWSRHVRSPECISGYRHFHSCSAEQMQLPCSCR
jgi:hypothetical protein